MEAVFFGLRHAPLMAKPSRIGQRGRLLRLWLTLSIIESFTTELSWHVRWRAIQILGPIGVTPSIIALAEIYSVFLVISWSKAIQ